MTLKELIDEEKNKDDIPKTKAPEDDSNEEVDEKTEKKIELVKKVIPGSKLIKKKK